MLTYSEIKDLCKYAVEPLAICPLCSSRCSETVCPAYDNFCDGCNRENIITRQKRKNEQDKHDNEEKAARLERWSDHLKYLLNDYTDLDGAYDDNADLVKSTFKDFIDALNKGADKVKKAKIKLKEDLDFVQRFIDGR